MQAVEIFWNSLLGLRKHTGRKDIQTPAGMAAVLAKSAGVGTHFKEVRDGDRHVFVFLLGSGIHFGTIVCTDDGQLIH